MEQVEREKLEKELYQLRINRSIDRASWFEHKRYAEELIHALGASGKSLMQEADNILVHSLKPTAVRIKQIEEILSIMPEKRINTALIDTLTSMGP